MEQLLRIVISVSYTHLITQRMLAANSIEIFNSYLPQIKDLYLPVENSAEYDKEFSDGYNINISNVIFIQCLIKFVFRIIILCLIRCV